MHASLFFLAGSDCGHERRSHQALEQWLEAFQSFTFQHFLTLSLEVWEGWLAVIGIFAGLEAPIQFDFNLGGGSLFLTDLIICLEKVQRPVSKRTGGLWAWCQTLIYISTYILYIYNIFLVCDCRTSFHIESHSKQLLNPGNKAMICRSMNPVWRKWWRLFWQTGKQETPYWYIRSWGRVIGHHFPQRFFFLMNMCNNSYSDVNYRVQGLWLITIMIYTYYIPWTSMDCMQYDYVCTL